MTHFVGKKSDILFHCTRNDEVNYLKQDLSCLSAEREREMFQNILLFKTFLGTNIYLQSGAVKWQQYNMS